MVLGAKPPTTVVAPARRDGRLVVVVYRHLRGAEGRTSSQHRVYAKSSKRPSENSSYRKISK
jgi:hypothetical protein